MQKILIDNWEKQEVVIGEKYELHYKLHPFIRNMEIEKIKEKLNASDTVKPLLIEERGNELIAQIEIIKNPLPLVAIIAVVGIAVGGIALFINLDKVYKIISDTPTGKWLPIGIVIIGLVFLLAQLKGFFGGNSGSKSNSISIGL